MRQRRRLPFDQGVPKRGLCLRCCMDRQHLWRTSPANPSQQGNPNGASRALQRLGWQRVAHQKGEWHAYAAEFSNHCGLKSWPTNSFIRHSVSKTGPGGPYALKDVSFPVQAHNPSAAVLKNGTVLLYHIGDGHADHGPAHTACRDGLTFNDSSDATKSLEASVGVVGGMLASESPAGPWRQVRVPVFDNPSPWVLLNGSIAVMHVIRQQPEDNTTQCGDHRPLMGLALADSPEGPYWPAGGRIGDDVNQVLHMTMVNECRSEDPHIWQDQRGNWHALFHDQSPAAALLPEYRYATGRVGHVYSRDLVHWTYSHILAAVGTVTHADGSTSVYSRRERPHLIMDPVTKAPTHLVTGVFKDQKHMPFPNCTKAKLESTLGWGPQDLGCDPSFTHIHQINTGRSVELV